MAISWEDQIQFSPTKGTLSHSQEYKKYRDKLGVSQDKLSKLAGVTLHTLTKIETGATPDPRIETLKKIANGLNVSV